MYRPAPSPRERAATVSLVVLIHAGLALALLNMSGAVRLPIPDDLTQMIEIGVEPPPPIVAIEPETEKAKKKEGAASAKNIESEATPVTAPKPVIPVPSPNPIVATPTPRQGAEATQGASDVVGPGTGAGGSGTGTGSGGAGTGSGGGGNGGEGSRATLATRALTRFDYPPEIASRWPRRGAVFAAVRVSADGRPLACRIDRSIGNRAIDDWTCSLILSRVRFNPTRDGNGRPIEGWYGYIQEDRGGR